jgi:hypothetical protein
MKNILLATILAVTVAFTVSAQTWQPVGTAGFTPAGAGSPSLAFNSNDEPYVAFKDGASAQKATVMKFDGTNWVTVGTAGFSSHFATRPVIAINSSNEPYVAYRDDVNATNNKLTVKKFDGTDWVTVGTAEFSGNVQTEAISLAFNSSDEPYVAFTCLDVINGGVNQATVMKFDGTNWVTVGAAGFSVARDISLAFNSNNEPFVAFRGNSNKATVMKFDGTNWVAVGTAGFSVAGSEYTSLAFNSNDEPYVAYRDAGNSDKVSVMKFDGTNWVTVGTAGFSAGVASYTSLAFNSSNEPYVAFREFVSGNILNQATVMKFDGTNWATVGTAGFSAGYADQTRLAINSNDEPYVAFVDLTQLYGATVMKFADGTMGISNHSVLKNKIAVYPNPANNIINFSVPSNVQLTNVNGQILTDKSNETSLDFSYLSGGIYFITFTDNDGQVLQRTKVVKE